jgi:hypothetical protein
MTVGNRVLLLKQWIEMSKWKRVNREKAKDCQQQGAE